MKYLSLFYWYTGCAKAITITEGELKDKKVSCG